MPDPNRKARRQARREANKNKNKTKDPSAGAGLVPDSSLGPGKFKENANWFLDDARLDPKDDPTLQPVIDAFQREAEEDFWRTNRDLRNNLASKNLLGSGTWHSMNVRAREEHGESMDTALANMYNQTRQKALDQRMQALGQGNERDIAAGNFATQRAAARISAAPGMAMARLQREQFNFEKPWKNMGYMIDTMRGLGDLSGYYENPNYVPGAPDYEGPPAWLSGVMGGLGTAMTAYGSYKNME